ncbi:MAG: hypothetical protein U0984_18010, partial [Prosthecobacter sp.]|nr:hypothetical protein [Prosthecobacter sp.]
MMPRVAAIVYLLAGGAVMAPLFASGHACEFLVAKMQISEGVVQLEITADYGGNPMIPDEDTARAAVQKILQVHQGGQPKSLEDLAPLAFERRQQWDPATPASFSPAPDGQAHELLTAVWRWQPKTHEVAFGVPDGSPNDVLLWTTAEHLPGKQVQWMLLIEGEKTPMIQVPGPATTRKF